MSRSERFPGRRIVRARRWLRRSLARLASRWCRGAPTAGCQSVSTTAVTSRGRRQRSKSAAIQRAAGSAIWRSVAQWQAIEPAPGRYDFATTDPVYCAALAAGLAPLFHITTTPSWAADPAFACRARCVSPPLPEHYPKLRRFAAALASRYPASIAIEAWNEPNLHLFWERPDPVRYVEVLREIDAGVDAVDPQMPVLLGGLSPVPADDPATGDLGMVGFLSDAYAAGAAEHIDAVNLHVYPSAPGEVPRTVLQRTLDPARAVIAPADGRACAADLDHRARRAGRRGRHPRGAGRGAGGLLRGARSGSRRRRGALPHPDRAQPADRRRRRIRLGDQRDANGEFTPFPVFCRFAALLAEPLDWRRRCRAERAQPSSTSRCTTRSATSSRPARCRAIRSAIVTERWRPPVQPIAIVRCVLPSAT